MPDTITRDTLDEAAIDTAHLERATFADRAFRDEVLGLFIREARSLLSRLASAPTDAEWKIAAHTLKGMARGVGAGPLAAAAAEVEPLVNGERLARRSDELARLQSLVDRASATAEGLMRQA
ncbi:MAG: Hpt domain-containing protein [Hyphomicrobiaceae bacterium]